MSKKQKQETSPTMGISDIFRHFKDDVIFEVTTAPINTAYHCVINEEFRHVRQFEDVVNTLENAVEGDYVEIQLSTVGGALHAVVPMLSAMKRTAAHVHVHACSDVSSAGTLIMMLAHSVDINEYATMMFHTVQYGYCAAGANMDAYVKHTTQQNDKLIREMYTGFLSEVEIQRLLDGLEIYMTGEECVKRLKNRADAIEVIEAAAQASKQPRRRKSDKKASTKTEGEKK